MLTQSLFEYTQHFTVTIVVYTCKNANHVHIQTPFPYNLQTDRV